MDDSRQAVHATPRRRGVARHAVIALVVPLLTAASLAASSSAAYAGKRKQATTTTTTTLKVTPPDVGVITPSNASNLSEVDAFESAAGGPANVVGYYAMWGWNSFDPNVANAIRSRGKVPEIAWAPCACTSGANEPAYALSTIANGSHDAYVKSWAQAIKSYGFPVRLRFAYEMNAPTYPWGMKVNGNTPWQFVSAWRHVHDVFVTVGARNVTWVFSPSPEQDGVSATGVSIKNLYPGDSYVDVRGIDGYNWGSSVTWSNWRTFDQVFGQTLALYKTMVSKPVAISETASTEYGGNKAAWTTDMFSQLKAHPEIREFTWFNLDKETDWRVTSSAPAQNAFANGLASLRSGT